MFKTIDEFVEEWTLESKGTLRTLQALTEQSLKQPVWEGGRDLGRLAWHVAFSPYEMLSRTGLSLEKPGDGDAVPTAARIEAAYERSARNIAEAVREQWRDGDLAVQHDMYGEMWSNSLTLRILLQHEVHHRGQLTVLMRQAGLRPADLYGPVLEDWDAFGMQPPKV
ncbi:hypothetical protein HGI30_02525 [Paenibacillus albicereus]|uniref:Damage-inducible protein DinB n=1 Tax=Paenibacillus albicereus TaxID=2726185 RepID=A0A6H2GTU9_9BACL|nr:DinB family protein [Paenibacillus albicereus]QJC50578.1 hypothetical protein HGI30_02525 [Paenibacillus albicereus]